MERTQLIELLKERVTIDNVAVPTEDGPMCGLCGAQWEYDGDTPEAQEDTMWHEDGCWVVRVARVLADEGILV